MAKAMNVILKSDVVGVGDIGEAVRVKPGYGRNYLIPQGLAVESGARNAKQLKNQLQQIEKQKRALKVDAESQAEKVRNTTIKLGLRVASGGKVFGSIGARDVAKALNEAGFKLDRRRVLLSDPIKKIGVHLVDVKLHADVKTQLKVEVEEIKATKKEEQEETEAARVTLEAKASEEEGDLPAPAEEQA